MTVERYLTVCHPFYHHSHSWPTRCYVLPIILFSLLYNTPRFFEMEIRLANETDNSNTTNTSDVIEPVTAILNSTNVDVPFELAASQLRLNYYYYTIYLVIRATFILYIRDLCIYVSLLCAHFR